MAKPKVTPSRTRATRAAKASRARPAARSTALATTASGTGATAAFGVILDVNGTAVPVSATDLANLKANGVEFTLQNPVYLGSIDDFEAWVNTQFGVQLPQASDFPGVLQPIVSAITGIKVTVEKAHLKVPGTSAPAGATVQYTLEANGMFASTLPLIPNVLGVSGFVFGFSNEATS